MSLVEFLNGVGRDTVLMWPMAGLLSRSGARKDAPESLIFLVTSLAAVETASTMLDI